MIEPPNQLKARSYFEHKAHEVCLGVVGALRLVQTDCVKCSRVGLFNARVKRSQLENFQYYCIKCVWTSHIASHLLTLSTKELHNCCTRLFNRDILNWTRNEDCLIRVNKMMMMSSSAMLRKLWKEVFCFKTDRVVWRFKMTI